MRTGWWWCVVVGQWICVNEVYKQVTAFGEGMLGWGYIGVCFWVWIGCKSGFDKWCSLHVIIYFSDHETSRQISDRFIK